jgi:hypothetical protein
MHWKAHTDQGSLRRHSPQLVRLLAETTLLPSRCTKEADETNRPCPEPEAKKDENNVGTNTTVWPAQQSSAAAEQPKKSRYGCCASWSKEPMPSSPRPQHQPKGPVPGGSSDISEHQTKRQTSRKLADGWEQHLMGGSASKTYYHSPRSGQSRFTTPLFPADLSRGGGA